MNAVEIETAVPAIAQRLEGVRAMRLASRDKGANEMAASAHQMREQTEVVLEAIYEALRSGVR